MIIPFLDVGPTGRELVEELDNAIARVLCRGWDHFMRRLGEVGIDVQILYPIPSHLQAADQHLDWLGFGFPLAEMIHREALIWPIETHLDDGRVTSVVEALKEADC